MTPNNKASKHVNLTILLGEVISEVKSINNGKLVTFMIETKSEVGDNKKEICEKHKIVCFDKLANFSYNNIKKGKVVHIIGSNRSKMIVSSVDNKRAISRDVVASQISII